MKDMLTVSEAAEYLGVSRTKVWSLVKEGVLSAAQNPLDKRERLIPATALQELRERRGPRERPWPRTIGIVSDGSVPSSEIEEYMREHWKPDW